MKLFNFFNRSKTPKSTFTLESLDDNFKKLESSLSQTKGLKIKEIEVVTFFLYDFYGRIMDAKADPSLIEFYSTYDGATVSWIRHDLSNDGIADDLGGELNVSSDHFFMYQEESGVYVQESILNTLDKNKMADNFYVFDLLPNKCLAGFKRQNGVIRDNLYLVRAFDNEVYDLKMNVKQYLAYGFSAGYMMGWQELFINKLEIRNVHKIGYYLPLILSDNIAGFYLEKLIKLVGKVEYTKESATKDHVESRSLKLTFNLEFLSDNFSLLESYLSQNEGMEITEIYVNNGASYTNDFRETRLVDRGQVMRDLKADQSIVDFYSMYRTACASWDIDANQTEIDFLDEIDNIAGIAGQMNVSFDHFFMFRDKTHDYTEESILKTIRKHKMKTSFYVFDFLHERYLIGFKKENGMIKDNLYLVRTFDDVVYDLKLNSKQYLDFGFSAGYMTGWQELFIDSDAFHRRVLRIGYYLPKILPDNISGLYMAKFIERFGELDAQEYFTEEDYDDKPYYARVVINSKKRKN